MTDVKIRIEQDRQLNVEIKFASRPLDVACDVYVRERKGKHREAKIGGISLGANRETNYSIGGNAQADVLDLSAVDVVLRPNVKVGARDVDVVTIWGEEVVFEDVAVHGLPDGNTDNGSKQIRQSKLLGKGQLVTSSE